MSIVLWPGGSYDGVDGKLQNVLEYMRTGETRDDFTRMIDNKAMELSNDDVWRSCYMEYHNRMHDAKLIGIEEGFVEGREKGLAEGREKGLECVAKSMLMDHIADDLIIKYTNITTERLSQLKMNDPSHAVQ